MPPAKTVSDRDAPHHVLHSDEFKKLHAYLERTYPDVWANLTVQAVGDGGLSLLLTWPGSQPNLEPLLFISHLDVVPVAEETLDQWEQPPFSGAIVDGYIWGRGALDVKSGVVGLLEATARLLRQGWQPTRTVLLGFGQDEEVGGDAGAGATADHLQAQGVTRLDAVIDEGPGVNVEGFPPYTSSPVALVATAEKGYYSAKVRVSGQGGHSSIPPIDHSSAGAAAGRLLTALDQRQPPGALLAPTTDFLQAIAPIVDVAWLSALFAHPERPGVADRILHGHLLVDTPLTAALARTTAAVTGIQAYVGDNVLPPTATINVNFRLLPGDTVGTVEAYLNNVVQQAGLTNVTIIPARPDAPPGESLASPVSPSDGRHFAGIKRALLAAWKGAPGVPNLTVAPFLLTGATDSHHYQALSRHGVLRLSPHSLNLTAGDAHRVHGINERVSVADFGRMICVYQTAIQLLAAE